MNLKYTHNKLLKSGFLPEIQNEKFEQWIDICENGTPISFSLGAGLTGVETKGAFKIHGRRADDSPVLSTPLL